MPHNKLNNWISRSQPDYYTLFIKAWLPFNAWYMQEFYSEDDRRTSDKAIIDHIKVAPNVIRTKIKNLLKLQTQEGEGFRKELGLLEMALKSHPITPDAPFSFVSLCIQENPNRQFQNVVRTKTCKGYYDNTLPRTSPRWKFEVTVTKTGATETLIELRKCSMTELETNNDYVNLSPTLKKGIKECLNEINPKKTDNFLKGHKHSGIAIGNSLYFIDDEEQVSKAVIQMLYELRCKLFHGEVDPTESNADIYKHAFKIMYTLIQELK